MRLFRSEEELAQWLAASGTPRGATMSLEQLWQLSLAWYASRLAPDFRGRTPAQAAAIFEEVGLTGPFWQPPG